MQQQWLVAGCVGAGRSAEAAADARLAAQHAVPAAGVAVRLLSQRGRLKVEPAPGATSSHYTSSLYFFSLHLVSFERICESAAHGAAFVTARPPAGRAGAW